MANRESAFGYKNVSGANIQEFTKTGYWKKPNNATFVQVEIWGGGGGGGGGGGCGSVGSGGGGGGAYNYRLFNASCLCGTVLVTIGAGGAGGASVLSNGTGNTGSNGGYTGFGAIAGTRSALLNAFGGGGGSGGGVAFSCSVVGFGGGVMSSGSCGAAGYPFSTFLQPPYNGCRTVQSAFGGGSFRGTTVCSRLSYGIGQFGGAAGGSATNSTTYPPHGRAAVLGGTGGGAGASPTNACVKSGGYGGSRIYIVGYSGQLGAKGGINTCAIANGKPGCNGCVVSTTYKQITLGYGGGGGAYGMINPTGCPCAPIYYTYSGGRGGNGAIGGGGGGGGGNMASQNNSPCFPLYGISTSGAGGTGGGGFARIYTW